MIAIAKKVIARLSSLVVISLLLGANLPAETRGRIEKRLTGDDLSITAYARSEAEVVVDYLLKAQVRGSSGNSNLSQKGEIALQKGVEQPLSTMNISYNPDKHVFVTLQIFADGLLLHEISSE